MRKAAISMRRRKAPSAGAFLACLALAFLFAPIIPARAREAAGAPVSFAEANKLYEAKKFKEAADAWEALISARGFSPALLYNLGNAYFRLGEVGKAILQYERAKRLAPRDRDILENLEYAYSLTTDKFEPDDRIPNFFDFRDAASKYSLNELFAAASAAFLLMCLAFAVRMLSFSPNAAQMSGWAAALLMALSIFLAAFAWTRAQESVRRPAAIVIARRVEAKSGPGPDFAAAFLLHEGTRAVIEGRRGEWMKIALPNGLRGWLPADRLERI